jgi:uncharacterized membrane protein
MIIFLVEEESVQDNLNDEISKKPERTLKDLTPNVAGLLCYVAGWISGIVFLVLEQKDRFIRFHALQSIILFGSLTVAYIVLGKLPYIGGGLSAIIVIIGAIFWIILMIKAYAGETYKVIWAGKLAEKLVNVVPTEEYSPPISPFVPPAQSYQKTSLDEAQNDAPQSQATFKQNRFRAKYYSFSSHAGRITGSAFAIAWSLALLIFFNIFSKYIAYYSADHSGGTDRWEIHTLVTSDFSLWLPIISVTLILAIIGNILMIIFDKYWLRQLIEIVLSLFTVASLISLLSIFPFDFSELPNTTIAYWSWLGLKILLILLSVVITIGLIVRFIKFMVNLAENKY